ncbi:MAG: apolipoprotein N-acyltransferase, partial [Bacteroidota bacterium]
MRLSSASVTGDLKRNVPWAALSGLLGALLFYPFDLWFLAPLALVPLLLALRRTKTVRAAGYLGLIFGWVMALISLHWLWSIFSTGMIAVCVLISVPWLLFGVSYRFLSARLSPTLLIVATPVLYTAMEWVRCQGWYMRFSWLQLGTSYVASQASQSTYPLIGIYGMTFLTVLVSAAIVAAIVRSERRQRLWGLAGTAALVAVVALSFRVAWLVRASHAPEEPKTVSVLMVQSETEDLDWLVARTEEYAQARPELIVWPELAVNDYVESDPETLARLQALSRKMKATLVLGGKTHVPEGVRCDWLRRRAMVQSAGELYYNSALVIGPDGSVLGRYHKRHPIQFFADGVPGPGYPVFPTPVARLGVAICYDLDFPDTALSLTRNGAEVLVVPTYDARDWGPVQQMQHARLALARAAEVGRWVVRPTSSGVSQIIAPGGEQVAFIPSGEANHRLGIVQPRTDVTPYVRGVWLLPYVCVGLSALLIVMGFGRRR